MRVRADRRHLIRGEPAAAALLLLLALSGCVREPSHSAPRAAGGATSLAADSLALTARESAFLDTLERRTFGYFWDLSDARTGLTPDRAPTRSFASVGAMGFALTAYPIGAERGWITRAQARERVLVTLRFLWRARQGADAAGCIGHHGFFYHFLDPDRGVRWERVELSTMDTALLMAGVLFCQSYFERSDAVEDTIRALADSLYARVDWRWAQPRPPTIVLGWTPEEGFLPYDWRGYNEAMLLHVLALGSPSHPVGADTWDAWTSGYRWGTFHGYPQVGFAPLFGHQYTQVWLDLRGVRDSTMRARGIDYFENSRRATLSQRAYAVENPGGFAGYGEHVWGLTACDGPLDGTVTIGGRERAFRTYAARGASFTTVEDDGTIAPTAAGGSIPFAPGPTIRTLIAIREAYGDRIFSTYGFLDAFNPTLTRNVPVHHGRVDPSAGWFDTDYLGIDQGPILAMAENARSGLVWRYMRGNAHVVRGLRRAGFAGGWLDSIAAGR